MLLSLAALRCCLLDVELMLKLLLLALRFFRVLNQRFEPALLDLLLAALLVFCQ